MLKKVLFGASVLAASVALATPAQAAFVVVIDDGLGNTVTLGDNDAAPILTGSASCSGGGDTNPLANAIGLSGCTIGDFRFSQLAFTNTPGSGAGGALASQALLNYETSGREILTFFALADSYTDPGVPPVNMGLSSSLSGTTALLTGTPQVTFQSYADGGSGLVSPTGAQVCAGITTGSLTTSCAGVANATGTFFRSAPTYTLLNQITLDTLGASSAVAMQITGSTAATVPEPGSMMLLGTGLFGLARVARRRFNR